MVSNILGYVCILIYNILLFIIVAVLRTGTLKRKRVVYSFGFHNRCVIETLVHSDYTITAI